MSDRTDRRDKLQNGSHTSDLYLSNCEICGEMFMRRGQSKYKVATFKSLVSGKKFKLRIEHPKCDDCFNAICSDLYDLIESC